MASVVPVVPNAGATVQPSPSPSADAQNMFRSIGLENDAEATTRSNNHLIGTVEEALAQPSAGNRNFWFVLTVVVVLPLFVMATSFMFGGLLAVLEEWTWMEGFYYVVGNLCALATPLTDVSPTNDAGKFFDVVIAVWSLSVMATFIGLVAGMSVVQRATGWLETGGKHGTVCKLRVDGLFEDFQQKQSIDFDEFVHVLHSHGFNSGSESNETGLLRGIFNSIQQDKGDCDKLDNEEVAGVCCCILRAHSSIGSEGNDEDLAIEAASRAEIWIMVVSGGTSGLK